MSDLIERDKAYEVIANYFDQIGYSRRYAKALINKVPSARPQGEWLDYAIPLEDGGAMPIQVCSLCKTFYPLAFTGGGHRFCPHCGARMKGTDDE